MQASMGNGTKAVKNATMVVVVVQVVRYYGRQ